MNRIKYPRTYHFDFSLALSSDDKLISSLDSFYNKPIVVTEKLDGECTTMYNDYIHARSIDSSNHESRSWVKQKQAEIGYLIPNGWRICGENVYAKHSIHYKELNSYFYVFNIWNEKNECLSWSETVEYCKLLSLEHVPVLYTGIFDYNKIKNIFENINYDTKEGIVCRISDSFCYEQFTTHVAKAVRENHIQSSEHWMNQKIIKNETK